MKFSIITDNKGNNYLICVNKVGSIFKIDIKKDIGTFEYTRDNLFDHGSKVNCIDFNPEINKTLTVKRSININDLDNLNIGFKIPNYEFVKDIKFKGATLNLSPIFNNNSIIVYGKSNFSQVLDLKNCKEIKKYKIDNYINVYSIKNTIIYKTKN